MLPRSLQFDAPWPRRMTGTAVLLAAFLVLETFRLTALGRGTPEFAIGVATSLPFIALLAYAGLWLSASDIPETRHRRVATWAFGGLALFLGINILIMPLRPRPNLSEYVAWVRWAAAIGGGTGALIGVFEARAVDRELAAERNRLRNEELEAQNDRLDEFATILSHDVRNPLNVAAGSLEVAMLSVDHDQLDAAAAALARMDELVEQTLTLARGGKVIGDPQAVSLRDLADHCWRNVATERATLDAADAPTVTADPGRLQHLLENLFRNAVEHGSPSGRDDAADAAVAVRVGGLPDGFYVADDGPGIPAADRETVLTTGYTTTAEGTGIGLAIVREIADAHGWDVAVTASETGGARFEFTGVDAVAADADG